MPLGDSTVLGTAGSGGDVFDAGLRGFFAVFPVLRLALAVLATFFRATFFVALPFVFFLAIDVSFSLPLTKVPPARFDRAACRARQRAGRSAPCRR